MSWNDLAKQACPQENISMVKDHFKSPDKGPEHFIDLFRRFYGPTMNAFDAAENLKAEELHSQLVELAKASEPVKERWHLHSCDVLASYFF